LTADFGDLTAARSLGGPASSSTRAVMMAGLDGPTRKNIIDYVTIATTGNATDFGDTSEALGYLTGLSSQTRGVSAGGNGPSSPNGTNQMEYITIASTGNATDFGALTTASVGGNTGTASPTRGLFAGGTGPGPSWSFDTNVIDYITIATLEDSTDFGDLTRKDFHYGGAASSNTRGVFAGGYTPSPTPATETNTMDYVTIASTGNAADFGDLTLAGWYNGGGSNSTRGIFTGRLTTSPTSGDPTIDSIIIATLGNAVNWGDMTGSSVRRAATVMSDSHGGIS